ncbi:unnamed protein product, partial [Nesidiocoris tenuis]
MYSRYHIHLMNGAESTNAIGFGETEGNRLPGRGMFNCELEPSYGSTYSMYLFVIFHPSFMRWLYFFLYRIKNNFPFQKTFFRKISK